MSSFAQGFAAHAHRKQRYGDEPYMQHLGETVAILTEFGLHKEFPLIIDAGWLHDILEDTDTTLDELGGVFDSRVGWLVWAVTGTGKTRAARIESIYLKCSSNHYAIALKLADRIANIRSAIRTGQKSFITMYTKEYETLVNRLRDDSMISLRPLWDELDNIIGRVSKKELIDEEG